MLCAFPAGVVECQCQRFTVAALEKMDACPPDTRASDSPPSSCSSISTEIKKRQRKNEMLDLSTLEDREAKTKEAIWSVRNQIPFWDVFITLPPPHQQHQTSKKMFFCFFFNSQMVHTEKKNFCRRRIQTFGRRAPPSEYAIFLLSIHSQHPFSPGWHLLLARGWINHT